MWFLMRRLAMAVGFLGGWFLCLLLLSGAGLSIPYLDRFLHALENKAPARVKSRLARVKMPTNSVSSGTEIASAPAAQGSTPPPAPVAPAITAPAVAVPAAAPAVAVAPAAPPVINQGPLGAKGMAALVPDNLHLLLPPRYFAVPNVEMNVYFENALLVEWSDILSIEIQCDIGHVERRRWTVVPTTKDVGEHVFRMIVRDRTGKERARGESIVCVVPPEAGKGEALRLLIVGDSYVHHTWHLNALARLLDRPGNPSWEMLGTHHLNFALPKVNHEGYGGWTWLDFLSFDDPNCKERERKRSPFLFPTESGKVQLDLARYFREYCNNQPPRLTIFELGINDAFGADPDRPESAEARYREILGDADRLIAEFHRAAPDMTIAVWMAPPMSYFEKVYLELYGPMFSRWRERRTLHLFQEKQMEHFRGREKDNIYLIPAYLNFDTIDGCAVGEQGHPNDLGVDQFAAGIYAWIKYWYASRALAPQLSQTEQPSKTAHQ